jgi:hypothetical protein
MQFIVNQETAAIKIYLSRCLATIVKNNDMIENNRLINFNKDYFSLDVVSVIKNKKNRTKIMN